MEVNCLLKAVAIARGLVWVVVWKEMGWLGGVVVWLPESVLSSLKNCVGLCLCEHDSTVLIHVCLLEVWMSCVICASSVLMRVSVGSSRRRESRSSMSRLVESVRLGMWPRGMCLWAAASRTRRKVFSPALQEEGSSMLEKLSSVS